MGPTLSMEFLIPRHAKEPGETHAYDLGQVLQVFDGLPLLEKSLVATAALAGLRQSELRGLEWTDYLGTELVISTGAFTHTALTVDECGETCCWPHTVQSLGHALPALCRTHV